MVFSCCCSCPHSGRPVPACRTPLQPTNSPELYVASPILRLLCVSGTLSMFWHLFQRNLYSIFNHFTIHRFGFHGNVSASDSENQDHISHCPWWLLQKECLLFEFKCQWIPSRLGARLCFPNCLPYLWPSVYVWVLPAVNEKTTKVIEAAFQHAKYPSVKGEKSLQFIGRVQYGLEK